MASLMHRLADRVVIRSEWRLSPMAANQGPNIVFLKFSIVLLIWRFSNAGLRLAAHTRSGSISVRSIIHSSVTRFMDNVNRGCNSNGRSCTRLSWHSIIQTQVSGSRLEANWPMISPPDCQHLNDSGIDPSIQVGAVVQLAPDGHGESPRATRVIAARVYPSK